MYFIALNIPIYVSLTMPVIFDDYMTIYWISFSITHVAHFTFIMIFIYYLAKNYQHITWYCCIKEVIIKRTTNIFLVRWSNSKEMEVGSYLWGRLNWFVFFHVFITFLLLLFILFQQDFIRKRIWNESK